MPVVINGLGSMVAAIQDIRNEAKWILHFTRYDVGVFVLCSCKNNTDNWNSVIDNWIFIYSEMDRSEAINSVCTLLYDCVWNWILDEAGAH